MKKKMPSKIFTAVAGILAFFGVSLIGIPRLPFILIVIFCIGYIIVNSVQLYLIKQVKEIEKKYYKKYFKKYNRILTEIRRANNADEWCEKVAQLVDYLIKNKKRKNKSKKLYSSLYKRTKQKIRIAVGAMVCFCIFNYSYVTSLAKGMFVLIESIQTLDLESMSEKELMAPGSKEEISVSEPVPEEPEQEEEEKNDVLNIEKQNKWIEFQLEYPDRYPGIVEKEFNNLYYLVFCVNEEDLDEATKSRIDKWMDSNIRNESLENATNSQGRSAGFYSEMEAEFSNEEGKRLSSNLLDEVIEGREELMEAYPNGTLAWLLSNHYQTYALNYLNQTNDARSTLYFYMKAIYNAQKSLEFEMDGKSKKERIEYIQFRYKDIAECELFDDEVRLRAYEILMAMENVLSESK